MCPRLYQPQVQATMAFIHLYPLGLKYKNKSSFSPVRSNLPAVLISIPKIKGRFLKHTVTKRPAWFHSHGQSQQFPQGCAKSSRGAPRQWVQNVTDMLLQYATDVNMSLASLSFRQKHRQLADKLVKSLCFVKLTNTFVNSSIVRQFVNCPEWFVNSSIVRQFVHTGSSIVRQYLKPVRQYWRTYRPLTNHWRT